MTAPIKIGYSYRFQNGSTKTFNLQLNGETLGLMLQKKPAPPLWALLTHKQCENCPLDEKKYPHCPVALNFADIAEQFKDMLSH